MQKSYYIYSIACEIYTCAERWPRLAGRGSGLNFERVCRYRLFVRHYVLPVLRVYPVQCEESRFVDCDIQRIVFCIYIYLSEEGKIKFSGYRFEARV